MFFFATLAFAGMEWSLTPIGNDTCRLQQVDAGKQFVVLGLMIAFVQSGYGRREFGLRPVGQALTHPRVGQPIVMFFFATLAFAGMEWTLPPFVIDRFHLQQEDAGKLFVYLGLMIAFVHGGLVRRMA